jgi:hypothetical protein
MGFEPTIQKTLNELRDFVKSEAPEAAEKISYGMPTFYLKGNLVYFAAFDVKKAIIKWAADGAGIRVTARGLGVSTDTVINGYSKTFITKTEPIKVFVQTAILQQGASMTFSKELLNEILKDYHSSDNFYGHEGIMKQFTKALVERTLKAELTEHLGYKKYDQGEKTITNRITGK